MDDMACGARLFDGPPITLNGSDRPTRYTHGSKHYFANAESFSGQASVAKQPQLLFSAMLYCLHSHSVCRVYDNGTPVPACWWWDFCSPRME